MRFPSIALSTVLFTFSLGCSDGHDHDHHGHHHSDTTSTMDMGAPGDSCTDTSTAICIGIQISHCDGSVFGAAEDCPEGEECMTMSDGMTHCMNMGGM